VGGCDGTVYTDALKSYRGKLLKVSKAELDRRVNAAKNRS
jgi:hypothetical protein